MQSLFLLVFSLLQSALNLQRFLKVMQCKHGKWQVRASASCPYLHLSCGPFQINQGVELPYMQQPGIKTVLARPEKVGQSCSSIWAAHRKVMQQAVCQFFTSLQGKSAGQCSICQKYADDTQLYIPFQFRSGVALEVLNWCLDSIMHWMKTSKLTLNHDKVEGWVVGGFYSQECGLLTGNWSAFHWQRPMNQL